MRLLVKRNPAYPLAKLPTRGSAQAAGYDLYACEDALIPKGGRAVVQTGIHIALPEGHYGRVAPRSGLAVKHGIDVGAGVVDADYRGLLGVVLFNFGSDDFQCTCAKLTPVHAGDRIAQLLIEKISTPSVEEVDVRTMHSHSRLMTRSEAVVDSARRAAFPSKPSAQSPTLHTHTHTS